MAHATTGRRIRKRRLKADINVVPYIDVMLVLLIIFMVTAPLLNLGTDIQLPDSRAKALSAPKDPIVVSIYADGAYALLIGQEHQAVTADELVAKLSAIQRQSADTAVLVRGQSDAPYQTVMDGINLIGDAGITKVSLLSRPEEGG